MICPVCHGAGKIRQWLSLMGGALWRDVPCESCGGCGVAHCCDGLCAQPEPDREPEKGDDAD